jgi:hypothetical protein
MLNTPYIYSFLKNATHQYYRVFKSDALNTIESLIQLPSAFILELSNSQIIGHKTGDKFIAI